MLNVMIFRMRTFATVMNIEFLSTNWDFYMIKWRWHTHGTVC